MKVVLLGDGSVGKTSLLISHLTDNFFEDYVPTVVDSCDILMKYGEMKIMIKLHDTAGQ